VAKIKPKQLTRGVKLLPEHVYDPLVGSMNQIVSGSLLSSQMEEPRAPCTIYFPIPDFDDLQNEVAIPLVLPLPQEYWNLPPSDFELPRYRLETLGLSFDTRAEPATITSKDYSRAGHDVSSGMIDLDGAQALTLRLTLLEKTIGTSSNPDVDIRNYSTIFTKTFDPGLFTGASARTNPVTLNVEDVELSHDKLYMLVLEAPGFEQGVSKRALPSLTLSLKISSVLMRHDSMSRNDQNYPPGFKPAGWPGDTSFPQDPNNITPAPDNAIIAAEVAAEYTPVQSAIELIDDKVRDKLKAGFNKYSEPPRNPLSSFVENDSGWCVMAVPCWGNLGTAVNTQAKAEGLPGHSRVAAGLLWHKPFHRSLIPIEHPMVVHHVVAAYNWSDDSLVAANPGVRPSGVGYGLDLEMEVGVAISGLGKGDDFAYQQVAGGSFKPNGSDASLIGSSNLRFMDSSNTKVHNWDLYSVPIYGSGTPNLSGIGYVPQGCPFYIGQSRSGDTKYHDSDNRSQVADSATGATERNPYTNGAENMIEVRWAISNKGGAGTQDSYGNTIYNVEAGATLLGRYGCWVYIIGKKILC